MIQLFPIRSTTTVIRDTVTWDTVTRDTVTRDTVIRDTVIRDTTTIPYHNEVQRLSEL